MLLSDVSAAVVQSQTENVTLEGTTEPATRHVVDTTTASRVRGPVFGEETYEDEIYGYQYEWFYRIRDYVKKNWKAIRGNLLFLAFFILFRIFCYR